jgi:tetratricopeptide (TPR) repeat protein
LAAASALVSCGAGNAYIDVIEGNYRAGRGEYVEAIVAYTDALDTGIHSSYGLYDMGNAYYALGEPEAASAVWDEAEASAPPPVAW